MGHERTKEVERVGRLDMRQPRLIGREVIGRAKTTGCGG